jgi:hypothetical protein
MKSMPKSSRANEALKLAETARESLGKAREFAKRADAAKDDLKEVYKKQAEEWLENAEKLADSAKKLAS